MSVPAPDVQPRADAPTGRYLDYLPAIFQQADADGEHWLGRFLLGFEAILTGLGDPAAPGLEELLDGIPGSLGGIERTFDPGPGGAPERRDRAPDEFLDWLAGWVALTLRADVEPERHRSLIANAVRLYRLRGTRRGLEELIGLYTTLGATIVDDGEEPHHFHVTIRLPTADPAAMTAQRRIVAAILDAEKPAHTYYTLDVETPVLQVGVTSQVGVDTLLGGASRAHGGGET